MDLRAACRAALEAAAQIDARAKTKLVKRALKHGMTEAEGMELAEAWKRAAKHTKRLDLSHTARASQVSSSKRIVASNTATDGLGRLPPGEGDRVVAL